MDNNLLSLYPDHRFSNKEDRAKWPVALVSMPFVSVMTPSIQLGLLKAIGEVHGFPVTTYHLALDFARGIGPRDYTLLAAHRGTLFGEWLFSVAAFGDEAPDPDARLLHDFDTRIGDLLDGLGDDPHDRLHRLREEQVPVYLDYLMETIAWDQFRVIGFTSTFQQNTASFALASRIKRRFPNVCLLFGGANFDGEMGLELVRSISCIDYAIIGEGDRAFPDFLIALQEGRDPIEVPGVVCRRDGRVLAPCKAPPFDQMDDLPVPDYHEFFDRVETLNLIKKNIHHAIRIPFESARGCWWGETQHCTFCGLNGATMAFRSKSPKRLQNELAELANRHASRKFTAVDNIVDMSYLKTFFAMLIEDGADYDFFYEVKSNLNRQQIQRLKKAGVRAIQPGIESLNSHVLKLMRKGVTAIQNVNVLRWALYYDIDIHWHLLWGFPGETPEDYAEQEELLPLLRHLPPPKGFQRISMQRFSPMFFDRSTFPMRYMQPESSYRYVYPEHVDLDRVAYLFDYEFAETRPDSFYDKTVQQVIAWEEAWTTSVYPTLTFHASVDALWIEDGRDLKAPVTRFFNAEAASIYLACSDRPRSVTKLNSMLGSSWKKENIEGLLQQFCAQGLMLRDGNLFLSLALPVRPN